MFLILVVISRLVREISLIGGDSSLSLRSSVGMTTVGRFYMSLRGG